MPDAADTRVSGRRAVAHIADGTLLTLLFVGALLAVSALPSGTVGDVALAVLFMAFLTFGQVAYFVLFQRRNGRTPGKWLVGIRVVDEAGRTPATGALVNAPCRS